MTFTSPFNSMHSIVCYSAIFGDIGDQLFEPVAADSVSYVAFVEPALAAKNSLNGWTLRPPFWSRPDKRRQARQHKCLSHELFPQATCTLWVDGCLTPQQDPRQLVEYLLNDHDVATFEHQERNCVYQEVEACIRLFKDVPRLLRQQAARYREEGYPYNNGLAETTAMLRRHTSRVIELNKLWWDEIRQGSVRDQISFDYACWRLRMTYAHLEGTRVSSPHFVWRRHR